jgi:hypothetical protein
MLVGLGAVVASTALLAAPAAQAANSPTLRDCSLLLPGLDPDFVQLSGVAVGPGGALTVSPFQTSLPLTASESSAPGDMSQHVKFKASVSSPGVATQVASGMAVGKVVLSIPLLGSMTGRRYTINWAATFDNGLHACPSPLTPFNKKPNPFLVTVR